MSFTRFCLFLAFTALLVPISAFSHQLPENFSGFEDPAACRDCHQAVYDEWAGSMHAKSSKLSDPVHAAVHEAFMAAITPILFSTTSWGTKKKSGDMKIMGRPRRSRVGENSG